MKLRSRFAAFVGRMCAFILTHIFHRNASQLPGRIALALAGPSILSDLCAQLNKGAIMVCGTNGKTTTNNVLAAALKESGASVVCNYAGANMISGIVSALLPLARSGASTDWAVLEVDELSCAHTLPQIKPRYFVLLNLFRDQLDRAGEIDKIQEVIATALSKTPDTTLVVCGDDPLCMGVFERLAAFQCETANTVPADDENQTPSTMKTPALSNKTHGADDVELDLAERSLAATDAEPASCREDLISNIVTFGIGEETGVPADRVPEARFCQVCGAELHYIYRHYAQLGNYKCPKGDFARSALDFAAQDVALDKGGVDFKVSPSTATNADTSTEAEACASANASSTSANGNAKTKPQVPKMAFQQSLHVPFGGLYMVYNMLAAYAVTALIGIPAKDFQHAVSTFHPDNGRLQSFNLTGQEVVLNLAKNPTGFNQNISLMLADPRPKHVFFVVNDNFNDGKDISWIWDVDFERLAAQKDLTIFVGGTRANELAVRMKYAGFGSVPIYFTAAEALVAMGDASPEKALTGMKDATSKEAPTAMEDATSEKSDKPTKQVEPCAVKSDCVKHNEPDGHSLEPLYILTNYSALWSIKAELEKMQKHRDKCERHDQRQCVQQHQHQHEHQHQREREHQHEHQHQHQLQHKNVQEHQHQQEGA